MAEYHTSEAAVDHLQASADGQVCAPVDHRLHPHKGDHDQVRSEQETGEHRPSDGHTRSFFMHQRANGGHIFTNVIASGLGEKQQAHWVRTGS